MKRGLISKLSGGLYDSTGHMLASVKRRPRTGGGSVFYNFDDRSVSAALYEKADECLNREPVSVTDKGECAPSGDKQDYYSIGAYWWPNPDTDDGLPFVWHDCERNPATELYSEASSAYDKTSLQVMIDSVVALTLVGIGANRGDMRAQAAKFVRHWFLNDATAMNPNLAYAQVHPGYREDKGAPQGIIEARDLALLPDMFEALYGAGDLDSYDMTGLRAWYKALLLWCEASVNGQKERRATNNHGTNYDLLTGSAAYFVRDKRRLAAVCVRAKARYKAQFKKGGEQPFELKRPHKFHYCTYNLQSWFLLLRLLNKTGVKLARFGRLRSAAQAIFSMYEAGASMAEIEGFVFERLQPIQKDTELFFSEKIISGAALPESTQENFHPYSGIPPFWQKLQF